MTNSSKPCFIFLAGVHGAGKSHLCQTAFEPAGFHCVSASSIIRSAKGDVGNNKTVAAVDSNQQKLLCGLAFLKSSHRRLILDGHFVLLRPNREFECIESSVFRALNPDAIMLIKADPELIADRLASRDATIWNSEFVARFQDCEIKHATRVAADLMIPLHVVATPEEALQSISTNFQQLS